MTFVNSAGDGCVPCAKGNVINDVCTCDETTHMLNNRGIACVPCWGPGAYLEQENDNCKCGINAVFDEIQEYFRIEPFQTYATVP